MTAFLTISSPVGDLDRAYTKRMADNFEEDMYLRKRLHARKFLKTRAASICMAQKRSNSSYGSPR